MFCRGGRNGLLVVVAGRRSGLRRGDLTNVKGNECREGGAFQKNDSRKKRQQQGGSSLRRRRSPEKGGPPGGKVRTTGRVISEERRAQGAGQPNRGQAAGRSVRTSIRKKASGADKWMQLVVPPGESPDPVSRKRGGNIEPRRDRIPRDARENCFRRGAKTYRLKKNVRAVGESGPPRGKLWESVRKGGRGGISGETSST